MFDLLLSKRAVGTR